MKRTAGRWIALAVLAALLVSLAAYAFAAAGGAKGGANAPEQEMSAGRRKSTPTPKPDKTPKPSREATPAPAATPAPSPEEEAAPWLTPVPEGPIIEPQAITDWLFAHDFTLPDNFITKKEAQALGWQNGYRYVSDAAPGMSIGGDRFGNYERQLPTAKGRQYYECDCYYVEGPRNAYRIIFSNDGLVFYTEDHYETFVQMFPSGREDTQP